MDELLGQVRSAIRGALRYRWIAIAVAWGICLVGWGAVWLIPNKYEARAKVYVDTESVLRPLLAGLAVNADPMNQLRMMQTVLMSRPNLERVARETDLALRAKSPADLERLVSNLPKAIGLVGGGQSQIFQLSFEDHDRAMAQRVVQAMLDSFVEDSIGLKNEDASSAQRFLETQIAEYEQKLMDAEARLANFKRDNVGLMPGEGGDYYSRLQAELTRLDDIQAKLRQATQRRDELVRQLDGEEPTFGLGPGGVGSATNPVDARIAELERKIEVMLVQLTEKHPDIQTLREQIVQLEERKRNARSARDLTLPDEGLDAAGGSRALAVNPVYQNMKISQSQTDVEIADLRSQLAEQQRVVGMLRGRVNTMPKVEADLAQLNRDYEVNRAQYTALLARLESARLGQQAQQTNEQVKFRIVEPTMSPRLPVSPNRILLSAAVLVVGIGAGLVLAVGLNLLRPVFSSRTELRNLTGLPVIGSIASAPRKVAVPWLRREGFWAVGATAGLLVAFFGLSTYLSLATRQLASL